MHRKIDNGIWNHPPNYIKRSPFLDCFLINYKQNKYVCVCVCVYIYTEREREFENLTPETYPRSDMKSQSYSSGA